jgi:hypothetical protein
MHTCSQPDSGRPGSKSNSFVGRSRPISKESSPTVASCLLEAASSVCCYIEIPCCWLLRWTRALLNRVSPSGRHDATVGLDSLEIGPLVCLWSPPGGSSLLLACSATPFALCSTFQLPPVGFARLTRSVMARVGPVTATRLPL